MPPKTPTAHLKSVLSEFKAFRNIRTGVLPFHPQITLSNADWDHIWGLYTKHTAESYSENLAKSRTEKYAVHDSCKKYMDYCFDVYVRAVVSQKILFQHNGLKANLGRLRSTLGSASQALTSLRSADFVTASLSDEHKREDERVKTPDTPAPQCNDDPAQEYRWRHDCKIINVYGILSSDSLSRKFTYLNISRLESDISNLYESVNHVLSVALCANSGSLPNHYISTLVGQFYIVFSISGGHGRNSKSCFEFLRSVLSVYFDKISGLLPKEFTVAIAQRTDKVLEKRISAFFHDFGKTNVENLIRRLKRLNKNEDKNVPFNHITCYDPGFAPVNAAGSPRTVGDLMRKLANMLPALPHSAKWHRKKARRRVKRKNPHFFRRVPASKCLNQSDEFRPPGQ